MRIHSWNLFDDKAKDEETSRVAEKSLWKGWKGRVG